MSGATDLVRRAPRAAARRVRRRMARVRTTVRGPAAVLMYHRVAEPPLDPWRLCVSPTHFQEHLEVLQGRPCLTFGQLVDALGTDEVPRGAVVVTFDDGYADNLPAAAALEGAGIPATMFVTTGAVDSRSEMWWDELERIVLVPEHLPERLELTVVGQVVRAELPDGAARPAIGRSWRADLDPPTSPREQLYLDLCRRLVLLPRPQQEEVLVELRAWAGLDGGMRSTHLLMTTTDLEALARTPGIEVGAHTVTHTSLPARTAAERAVELGGSRAELEERLDRTVDLLAYPYGRHDPATVADAAGAGYRAAVTTAAGPVRPRGDLLRIPRFHVDDWGGDRFARMLAEVG
jgi:peptidoglycan/xylan/chitin deacetylase (PgdA/CDA1 family)